MPACCVVAVIEDGTNHVLDEDLLDLPDDLLALGRIGLLSLGFQELVDFEVGVSGVCAGAEFERL